MDSRLAKISEFARVEHSARKIESFLDEAAEQRKPSFEPRAVRSSLELLLAPPDPSRQKPPWLTDDQRHQRTEEFRRLIALQNQLRGSGTLGVLRRSAAHEGWRLPSLGIVRGSSIMGDLVGSVVTPGEPEVLPNIRLSDEDYSLIYRNAGRGIPVILEFNIQNRFRENDLMAYNAVGEIPGTDKRGEVVMLGAPRLVAHGYWRNGRRRWFNCDVGGGAHSKGDRRASTPDHTHCSLER